jgi:hypothetical protein
MKRPICRKFSRAFKAKVALEVIKDQKTLVELHQMVYTENTHLSVL